MLASGALGPDQLQEIAEDLVVDADERTVELGPLPDDVAGPLVPLGEVPDVSVGPGGTVPAGARGHVISYQGVGDPLAEVDDRLDIALFTGDAGDLAVTRWSTGAHTASRIRGHRGWTGPAGADGTTEATPAILVWEESPGVLAVAQGFGLRVDDVRASVESLRPATDDEWDALVDLAASQDFAPPDEEGARPIGPGSPDTPERGGDEAAADVPDDAVGGLEGVYADGAWAVYLRADGAICGVVDDGRDPAETCEPDRVPVATLADGTGRPVLLFGVMPDGAVGRLTTDGHIELSQTYDPAGGASIYAMVVVDGEAPSEITFVGADGREAATVPVPVDR